MSHEEMINKVITFHFNQHPKFIKRMTIGICNEVYLVGLNDREVIIRLSPFDKYLMGSHDHIPPFKKQDIKVPDILFENYSKMLIPLSYQIQSKIEGIDLGNVIDILTDDQLRAIAKKLLRN